MQRLLFITLLLICGSVTAQVPKRITIGGPSGGNNTQYRLTVEDSITGISLHKAEVMAFLPGDSAVVADAEKVYLSSASSLRTKIAYWLTVPQNDRGYSIVVDADGYMTRTIAVPKTRAAQVELGTIKLMKMPKQLNEVTVTASKIKMYYKGDTLVYNADAFMLPDGSMLDELIKKLDGVTINQYGQIYCNGRLVRSLHLDGRKLFDGNPRTLLENLGAYTVSKIKVYDYTSNYDKFTGFKSNLDKPLIMDVVLKQEYSLGKWVNIDAGYGTSNRYLGRAFALGFSKTFALASFFNANNLSAGDDPQKGQYWNPSKAANDESRYLSGGLSYQFDPVGEKYQATGQVAVNSDNRVERSGLWRSILLPDRTNTSTSYYNSRIKGFSVSTSHSFSASLPKVYLSASPNFRYSRHRSNFDNISATFNADLSRISEETLRALYADADESELLRLLVNRNVSETQHKNDGLGGGLSAATTVKLPGPERVVHNIAFNASGNYSETNSTQFEQNIIDYGLSGYPEYRRYSHNRNNPTWEWGASGNAKYNLELDGRHMFILNYGYNRSRGYNTNERYLLDNLDLMSFESLKFGQLPPDADLESVLDPDNSVWAENTNQTHSFGGSVTLKFGQLNDVNVNAQGKSLTVSFSPSVRYHDRSLHYSRVNYDTTAVRRDWLPAINAHVLFVNHIGKIQTSQSSFMPKYTIRAGMSWNTSPSLINMGSLINLYSTSNPLYIYHGNPDLRNSYRHSARQTFSFTKTAAPIYNIELVVRENFTTDAIVDGYVYDPTTGVRTGSVYNVNGNRGLSTNLTGFGNLYSHRSRLLRGLSCRVGFGTEFSRRTSMDAVGAASRSYVYVRSLNPSASLSSDWSSRGHSVSLRWSGRFNRYHGTSSNYLNYSATNMEYGAEATFALPANFRVSTNFTYYTRRGYIDESLNTNEAIWNVTASWHWKKANLTFLVDGYDLLGQIKTVSYYVDALGRTEIWRNSLPRYALLRVRYHIDLSPK